MRIERWCKSSVLLGVMTASLFSGCGEQQDDAEPFPEGTFLVTLSEALPEPAAVESAVVGDEVADLPEAQADAPETIVEEGEDLSIPASLSDEVPIMEGFKATRISSTKETGDYNIYGTSSESLADIVAFYDEAAVAKGWSKLPGMIQEATAMANFRKGPRMLQILIRREEDRSVVSITLGNM